VTGRLKILTVITGILIILGIVFVGVAFAEDNESSQVYGCCDSKNTCSGYCQANGELCGSGNCIADCTGVCNTCNDRPITAGCCMKNQNQLNTGGFGGCCGGLN
jgi:hypothetical protein